MILKNIASFFSKTAVLLLLAGLYSCGTYNTKTTIEADLYNGQFKKAVENIDSNKFLNKERNRLLYLMEKGKMEHLLGNYKESNALLEKAYIMIEDKITINAGQVVASKLTNPMAEPYRGEDFEKVTIHYYMALNYFHLGLPNEALVEAKRINIKLLELNDKYPNNKNKYSSDAFSQILQGLIYESTGDTNNAFIAYRNAAEIYDADGGNFFGIAMPEQLKYDLARTAKQMGFMDEYNKYLKQYKLEPIELVKTGKNGLAVQPNPPVAAGEAIIFWENGLAPAKDQIILNFSAGEYWFYASYMEDGVVQDIILPIPMGFDLGTVNAIAIPKYRKRESFYSKATVLVNGAEMPLQTGQDFYPIAKQCLKDRMLREVVSIVTRFAAKKAASAGMAALGKEMFGKDGEDIFRLGGDIAGAATEKADTRNWQSLPATIGYARVPLQEGENKFTIKKYGQGGIVDTDTITIPFKEGLQIVNYFDLGRTQVFPDAVPSETTPVSATPLPTTTGALKP
ncbi:COG3014 family protein [Flavobacterium hauense]